ncbi:glycosyltransferase family 2 protein [Pseudoroseomonas wenyumeiae]
MPMDSRPVASISVVVPTYNRAALLPATLDAILSQTLRPLEVIIVDDGSTDDTAAVLARYGRRLRVLRVPNGGDLKARNAGLAEATGDLVAFCDSDDLWKPGFLAAMLRMWQVEPALRVAFSDFVILRDDVWQEDRKFADAPRDSGMACGRSAPRCRSSTSRSSSGCWISSPSSRPAWWQTGASCWRSAAGTFRWGGGSAATSPPSCEWPSTRPSASCSSPWWAFANMLRSLGRCAGDESG